MALARLDIPSRDALRRLDRARPLARATTSRSRTSSRRSAPTPPATMTRRGAARARGRRQPRRRRLRRPVHRQHDGMAFEVLGHLARWARAMVPAEDDEQGRRSPTRSASWSMRRARRGPAPERDDHPRVARERDRLRLRPRGGSTNGVLHLLARRPRGRRRARRSTTSSGSRADAAARRPQARRPLRRHRPLRRPAACRWSLKRLLEAGLLHDDAITVTGRTIGEEAARGRRDRRARRSCARSTTRSSRAAAWRSCAATSPPRAASSSSPAHERRSQSGPARVFECEEDCFAAVKARADQARRRRRDPQRGPGRRPRHARDARRSPRRSSARASARRSRCSPTAASPARPTA